MQCAENGAETDESEPFSGRESKGGDSKHEKTAARKKPNPIARVVGFCAIAVLVVCLYSDLPDLIDQIRGPAFVGTWASRQQVVEMVLVLERDGEGTLNGQSVIWKEASSNTVLGAVSGGMTLYDSTGKLLGSMHVSRDRKALTVSGGPLGDVTFLRQ